MVAYFSSMSSKQKTILVDTFRELCDEDGNPIHPDEAIPRVIVATTTTLSVGINLQIAPCLIQFECEAIDDLEQQAMLRISRWGQMNDPTFYFKFLAHNTIEKGIDQRRNIRKDLLEKSFEKDDVGGERLQVV